MPMTIFNGLHNEELTADLGDVSVLALADAHFMCMCVIYLHGSYDSEGRVGHKIDTAVNQASPAYS